MKNIILLILFFFSCNIKNIKTEQKNYVIESDSIAVLPFDNYSNDLAAEDILRDLVIDRFKKKGWIVIDKSIVDERLKSIGITDGGQLRSVQPQELIRIFNTRYLCYANINEFKFQNIGFVITKKVELNMKIYDNNKGEYIFDETTAGSDTKVYLNKDDAKKAFLTYNALKLVENIMKRPLYKESVECVDKMFRKF